MLVLIAAHALKRFTRVAQLVAAAGVRARDVDDLVALAPSLKHQERDAAPRQHCVMMSVSREIFAKRYRTRTHACSVQAYTLAVHAFSD